MTIHSRGQTISSFPHIEGITLSAGEKIYVDTGRTSGMVLDGVGLVNNRLLDFMGQFLQQGILQREVEKYQKLCFPYFGTFLFQVIS